MPPIDGTEQQTQTIPAAENAGTGTTGIPTPPVQDLVDYKDPKTGSVYKIPKGAMDGFNYQFKMARTSAESETKKKFESIMTDYEQKKITVEEMANRIQQMEEANLSESEKLRKEMERLSKTKDTELKTFKEQADKNFSLFKNTKIDNDLYGAISTIGNGIEAANPQQLALLLKTMGNAELVEENGNYSTKISLTIDGEQLQLSPKDAVIKFLSLPENAHHIKNNLKSGGGTSSTGTRTNGSGVLVFKPSDLENPELRKQYMDAAKAGKNPIIER